VEGTRLYLKGEKSGEGEGHSEVPTEDVADYLTKCEAGGVSEVRYTAYSYTRSPLVSGSGGNFPSPGGGLPTGSTRLLLGPTRGMYRARPGHPFRVRVRALGGRLRATRVVVRDRRGRRVGRSRTFSLGTQRKRVQVRVRHALTAGRYTIVAAGRDAAGRRVRAVKHLRLRRHSRSRSVP
jgi:hypothetical protein